MAQVLLNAVKKLILDSKNDFSFSKKEVMNDIRYLTHEELKQMYINLKFNARW